MEVTTKELASALIHAHMAGQVYENPDNEPGNFEAAKDYVFKLFEPDKKSCNAGKASKECYECKHRMQVPGSTHSACSNPDRNMTGDNHGIKNGWFFYPVNFDPTWKTKFCNNHEKKD